MGDTENLVAEIETLGGKLAEAKASITKRFIGQERVVELTLTALLCGGHGLLIGLPGLGKTRLVETLSTVMGLHGNRIQFTPDLMPADILGTNMVVETETGGREFQFQKGPIFTQVCLADEINRATPKTQSAMLETMQEGTVTVAGNRYVLDKPFFVLATQNPIEQEGTYPLPEAQLDRFLFKLVVGYSNKEDLMTILDRTTKGVKMSTDVVMDGREILEWQQVVRQVIVADHISDYIVRLNLATHPDGEYATPVTNQYLRWGASPRGAQTVVLAAKVRALLEGRFNVSFEDVRRVYLPAMRHRVVANFEAQAEGITSDQILLEILDQVSEKGADA